MPGWKLANLATQACLTEFGVPIVFTPAGGAPESQTVSGRPLRAVFDDARVQILYQRPQGNLTPGGHYGCPCSTQHPDDVVGFPILRLK